MSQGASTPTELTIALNDQQGKLIRNLFQSEQKSTSLDLTFNTSDLSQGNYFLTVKNNSSILKTISIVID